MTIPREPPLLSERQIYRRTQIGVLLFLAGFFAMMFIGQLYMRGRADFRVEELTFENASMLERAQGSNAEIARLRKDVQRQVDARLAVDHECDFREAENDRLFRLLEQRLSDVPPPMEIDILQPLENTEVPPPVPDLIPENPIALKI